METKFTVPEISCGHCKETIESTVSNIESVVSVAVDIEQKSVAVKSTSDLNLSLVSEMLDEQGYTVVQSS
jgi:copper chaperone|tara:strand:+ start:327 stop:536 length:210 start_codon:yes stop_codon:yes gene_type:complete